MSYLPMEETDVYLLACKTSDEIYRLVVRWPPWPKTLWGQLIRAADSIGANLVEGDARRSDADSARYFRYARSSAREAAHFVCRSAARDLLSQESAEILVNDLKSTARMINGILRFRAGSPPTIRETVSAYGDSLKPDDELDW